MKTMYFGLSIDAEGSIEHLVDFLSRRSLMRASMALQTPEAMRQNRWVLNLSAY